MGGLVLGGICGAAVGLLLAPTRGPLLPRKAWHRVDEAKNSLLEAVRARPGTHFSGVAAVQLDAAAGET